MAKTGALGRKNIFGRSEGEAEAAQEAPTSPETADPKAEGVTAQPKRKAAEQAAKTAHNAHAEAYSKQTVVLFDRQLGYLRRLQGEVLAETGEKVSISELLRGLVDVLEASNVEPGEVTSGEALADALRWRLGLVRRGEE